MLPAAPIFTTKGGWWDQGEPPDSHLNRFPATAEEARRSVREAKALGAAEIKLMLDDMALVPRAEGPVAEGAAGDRRGPHRRGPRGGNAGVGARAQPFGREDRDLRRRDRAGARRSGPLR